jgi:hypothetical protein
MSTTEFNLTKGNTATRVADFIAFVNDRKTEQVLKSFVLDQAMPHTYIAIGGVNDALRQIRNRVVARPVGGCVRAVGSGRGARRA